MFTLKNTAIPNGSINSKAPNNRRRNSQRQLSIRVMDMYANLINHLGKSHEEANTMMLSFIDRKGLHLQGKIIKSLKSESDKSKIYTDKKQEN